MSSNFNVSIILKLIDKLTGPARASVAALGSVKTAVRGAANAAVRFEQNFRAAEERLSKLGTASMAFDQMTNSGRAMTQALIDPINAAGKFQSRLAQVGRVAGATATQVQVLQKSLREASKDTNQMSGDLLEAFSVLTGKGMGIEAAMAAIAPIAKVATAEPEARLADIALAGFAAMDNLKVPASELIDFFDAIGIAADQGGFEVKDMARHFPGLTGQLRALRMEGVPAAAELAAALQFSLTTATGPDQAARNMENFLAKLTSPDTVRRFEEFGVSVEDEMKVAAERGVSPLMHMLELVQEMTRGDKFRIGELFGDQQAQKFLDAVLPNIERIKTMRDEALAGAGFTDDKATKALRDYTSGTLGAAAAMDELSRSVGRTLLPIATKLVNVFAWLSRGLSWVIDHTGVFGTVIAVVVGALGGLLLVAGFIGSSAVSLIGTFIILDAALKSLGISAGMSGLRLKVLAVASLNAGKSMILGAWRGAVLFTSSLWSLALRALPAAIAGMRAFALAVMANPIGLIIGAIAIGATLIIANWSKIAPFFAKAFGWMTKAMKPVWSWFKKLFGFTPLGMVVKNWKPILAFFSALFSGIGKIANTAFNKITSAIQTPLKWVSKLLGLMKVLPGFGAASLALAGTAASSAPAARSDNPAPQIALALTLPKPDVIQLPAFPQPALPPPGFTAPRPAIPLPVIAPTAPSAAAPTSSIDGQAPASISQTTTVVQRNEIIIKPAPNTDVRELAKEVQRVLDDKSRRALHDGVS